MTKPQPQPARMACNRAARLTAMVSAAALALAPMAAPAQENKGPALLRDTEIEQLLREYTRPILGAAGLEKHNIQIVIINDSGFNAFVADGR
ncbi:MAG TPA: M48 family peptidase, partial [Bradyrhizobium sp.]|nr:M48 family peptidase [Bradyrhizobium sp.]